MYALERITTQVNVFIYMWLVATCDHLNIFSCNLLYSLVLVPVGVCIVGTKF